ncbi:MAG: GLUG motif-containing protein [Planctomycetota bacterium]|jgi:hypothetical protein
MCRINVIVLSAIVFLLIPTPSQGKYSGGTGDPNTPYRITTAADLNDIGKYTEDWVSHFVLTDDINLTGYSESNFNLIGVDWEDFFSGVFDGNGHTISNFTYNFSGPYNMGLFRYVSGSSAQIKNLTLADPNIDAGTGDDVGTLVGRILEGVTISNCHVRGGVVRGNYGNGTIGGLAGFNWGSMTDCSAEVTVSGYGNTGGSVGLGGLVGSNRGSISNCYVTGTVDGNDYYAGGLVGYNSDDGVISNSYAWASVEGTHYAGGLAGNNRGSIADCNAIGTVSGTWSTGGLVGFNRGTIERCYCQTDVTGDYETGGLVGASYTGSISNCYAVGDVNGGIYGADDVGGFIGRTSDPISNCFSDCNVTGVDHVGGFVGTSQNTLTNCYALGSVSGNERVGGLVGQNDSTISSCYSAGSLCEGASYVGGFVGINIGTGSIENCYSSCGALGDFYVGGLAGMNFNGSVTNCYSVGSVTANLFYLHVGALIGDNNGGTVTNSFWDTQTSLPATSSDGGTGLGTADMQMLSTFTDAGWDFNTPVWTIWENEDYPRLRFSRYEGAGTASYPYLIRSACQMQMIGSDSNDWDKHFKLMADIDLSAYPGETFNLIGNMDIHFTGIFDGNNHTISNFSYDSAVKHSLGIFSRINDPNAILKNLGLIDPNISAGGGDFVGSLVGEFISGTVIDCYSENGMISGDVSVGGLVGNNTGGTIERCYSTCDVLGNDMAGGLAGSNWDPVTDLTPLISQSYAKGSVVCTNDYGGGLVGFNMNAMISKCYAWGDVFADRHAGGLAGFSFLSTISDCYSVGSVSGGATVGGLVGYNTSGTVTDSFWDMETAFPATTSDGGTAKTTAQMQTESTFTDSGWDFSTPVWEICEGTNYPKFAWQIPVTGDFVCPDGVDFVDYSFFSNRWRQQDCGIADDCDGADLDFSDVVDWIDLKIFCDQFLDGTGL